MAKFAGFNITTPQEAQQRQQQMRLQLLGSNNPLLIQQAIFGNAFDSLFGNPEVRAAQKVQQKLSTAVANAAPGEDELGTEINRLSAVRDAVADLDPNLADQVRARLVELEGERLERNKLLAEERRAEAGFQLEQLQGGVNVAQDANDSDTWYKGSQTVEVLKTDAAEQARLRAAGWIKSAPQTEAEATARLGVSKPTAKDLESNLIAIDRQLASFAQMGAKYDPEFLTMPESVKQFALGATERLLGEGALPDSVKQRMGQYQEWRSATLDNLNRLIKEITGAAMSINEAERITATAPTPTLSDSEYLSRARRTVKELLSARVRAQWALDNGIRVEDRGDWDKYGLDKFGNVSEEQVDAVMTQMFGTAGPGRARTRDAAGSKQTRSGVKYTIEK